MVKERGKDVGYEVLQDFEDVEKTARASEYPSRVREGRIYLRSFSRLTNRRSANTLE
jgi:hypothetical protein